MKSIIKESMSYQSLNPKYYKQYAFALAHKVSFACFTLSILIQKWKKNAVVPLSVLPNDIKSTRL